MFKNYFVVAIRYLMRHKLYTSINLSGLGLGLACCLMMALFVKHEWAYDGFHENEGKLFRVVKQRFLPNGEPDAFDSFDTLYPPWVVNALQDEIPGVIHTSRFMKAMGRINVEKKTFWRQVGFVSTDFFKMFTFLFLVGDPTTALARPDGVVLTESLARQIFGDVNENYSHVLGQSLTLQRKPFVVTGVMADVPKTSSLQFQALVLAEGTESVVGFSGLATFGEDRYGSLYIQIGEGQLPGMLEKLNHWDGKSRLRDDDFRLLLQPLKDVYWNDEIPNKYESKGSLTGVYILWGIAWIVLLIACSNFVSLSVAGASGRIMEVGLRKVLGANQGQIMRQFWTEALLLSFMGLLLGIALAEVFLPVFNGFVQRNLQIVYFEDGAFLLLLLGTLFIVGLVAGSYPALVLSRLQPTAVMQRGGKIGGQNRLTRILIVLQYIASIVLIIGTGVIVQQQDYLENKDLGYNEEQILIIGGPGNWEMIQRYKREILRDSRIAGVTISDRTFTNGWSSRGCHLPDGSTFTVRIIGVDVNYLSTLEISLLEGRNFSEDRSQDRDQAILINEALAKQLETHGISVGQILNIEGANLTDPVIIGVVRDFHTDSLYEPIQPTVLQMRQFNSSPAFLVRIYPDKISETIAMLKETWQAVVSDVRFRFSFLDKNLHQQYHKEERWREIISYSALFSIIISCLGLFGLASLTVARRTKEIGIRKVLGASEGTLIWLLSKDFAKLLLVANVIAWPVAYWIMDEWLTTNFVYRIDLGIWVFIFVGVLTYVVAQVTILGHILKVIRRNPVDAFRYE